MKKTNDKKLLIYKICLECPLAKCSGDCKRLRKERKKICKSYKSA